MSTSSNLRLLCLVSALTLLLAAPALAADVSGSLALDPTRLAGADDLGRMLLYTPDPLEASSSISHWDFSATPDLLMEPAASPNVPFGEVDLTLPHFRDIGWPVGTSTITIRVTDAAEAGFNDPTPVAEAPNNPGGTTLGGQRLAAMRWAASIWAAALGSSVRINVESSFDELDCDPDDGTVLAYAGATFVFTDFANAPRQGTWYHGALAEGLAGENLSSAPPLPYPPEAGDLAVTFNSSIDEGCLEPSFRFYYGLDGNAPAGQVSFVEVALHEIAHGLGFADFVDVSTGSLLSFNNVPPQPDIYTVYVFDKDLQLHWNVMTDEERRSSAVNSDRVVWDGPRVTESTVDFLDNAPRLAIGWPRPIAGSYKVQSAQFGPPIDFVGVSGGLAVVDDGSGDPTLGCDPLVNADEIAGRIAVVDRGTCYFTVKVKNAQDAGAVAVIVVNNVSTGLPPMGGADPTITIPSAGISLADGELIKSALDPVAPRRGVRRGGPAQ